LTCDDNTALTAMALAPSLKMYVAATMTVSLTPALSRRARERRSALRATFIVNVGDFTFRHCRARRRA